MSGNALDDNLSTLQTINAFNYNGVSVTSFTANSNGWMSIGGALSTTLTGYSALSGTIAATGAAGVIAPLAGDLVGPNAGSEVRWEYLSGSNETVIQWSNMARWVATGPPAVGVTGDNFNFQVRLNHTTNTISLVYGSMTFGSNTSYFQVGMKNSLTAAASIIGTTVTNLTIKNIPAGTSCSWADAISGRATSETMLGNSTIPAITCPTGTTFTFTRQVAPIVNPVTTFATATGITGSAASISWTAPTNATQYNVQYRAVGTCAWTNHPSNPISTASATISGLSSATSYQVRVQSMSATNTCRYSHAAKPTTAFTDGYVTTGYFTTLTPACQDGAFVGGTATSAAASVCGGSSFTLNVTGSTNATGFTYQWYDDVDGDLNFTAIPLATGATLTTSTTVNNSYRREMICLANSTNGIYSTAFAVTALNCTYDVAYTPSGVPYTSIMSTGTVMSGWQSATSGDDNTTTTQSLAGTTFAYQGTPITGFQACTNGWMTFNTSNTSVQWGNALESAAQVRLLAPFWDDLVLTGQSYANRDACMRYEVSGTLGSGSAVITIEWAGLERFNIAGPNLNFQVKLYEAGNLIEFVYGNFDGFDGTVISAYSYSIGYNGATPAGTTAADRFAMQTGVTNHWGTTASNSNVQMPNCYSKFVLTPGTYTGPLATPAIAAPANDNSGTATLLTTNFIPCTSYCGTYYTSRNATSSSFGLSTCTATAGSDDDDVWFTFQTTALATDYTLRLRNSPGYDGVLQLLDATLTPITCVNATGAGLIETINATGLTPGGTTYYIRVYHNGVGFGTSGQFSICASEFFPPPANDNCAGATSLTPGATCTPVNGSTLGASLSADAVCGGNADDDVWYKFVAVTDNATINVQSGTGFNAAFSVLSGTCGTLTSLACPNLTSTGGLETATVSGLTPGLTYYIRIYHSAAGTGTGAFSVCVQTNCTDVTAVSAVGDFSTVDGDVTWTGGNADVYIALATDPAPDGLTTPTASNVTSPYNTGTLVANTNYVAYVRKNCGAQVSNWSTGSAFDTSCPPISGVSAVLATSTTANVSWTGSNADIFVGSGTPGAPTFTNVTSPQTISTPSALTTYTYYVRSNCGGGNTGSWQGPFTVTTGCGGSSCTYTFNLTDSYGDGWNGMSVNVLQEGVVVATLTMATGSALAVPVTICDDAVFELEVTNLGEYEFEPGLNVVTPWGETVLTGPAGSLSTLGVVYTGTLDCDAPTCSTPTTLALGTFGGTTANITWSTASTFGTPNSWEWVVVPQGEDATYTPTAASGFAVTGAAFVTGLTGSTAYTFWVRANCGSPDYSDWAGGTFTTRPGNDACADAFVATCGNTYTGTTVNSVNELQASQCGAGTGAQSSGGVWYKFVGTDNSLTASLCGSSFDTRISVYSGSCGTLTCVGGNDDFCGAGSQTSFNAYLGTDYYILVHGFGTGTGAYTLSLTCDVLCVSSNDECAIADVVPVNGAAVSADNTCATVGGDANPGFACGGSFSALSDEWYSFNPSYRTQVGLTVSAVEPDPISGSYYYALYTGTCGSLTYVNCGTLTLGTEATISGLTFNADYKLRIYTPNATFAELGTYSVALTGEALCTGSPVVGTTTAPITSVCLDESFTLSVPNTSGWSYQWQRQVASAWTNIVGATAFTYTGTQTATTNYRCYVVCLPTTGVGISSIVTMTTNTGASCYCSPTYSTGSGIGDYIESVQSGTINNVSGANPSPYYTVYPAAGSTTTTFTRSGQYSVTVTNGGYDGEDLSVWVDFDQNGSFSEAERVGSTYNALDFTPFTYYFTVPANAVLGTTRMRVRAADQSSTSLSACGFQTWGETEDYVVTIAPGAANDAIANATAVSPPNYPACLNLSGNLALATDDPADVTSSGVDLWYRFTASSNACRIAVSGGTSTDTQIEIENSVGATMGAVEDATSANGNETYVFGGLTAGQQYWVAVRNAPTGTPGTFSLCIQSLAASTCDNGPVYASLCSSYKARWTGTASYTATFTSVDEPGNVYSYTTTNTSWIPLSIVPGTLGNVDAGGLQYGESYSVTVVANYNLPDANGVTESVTAVPTAPSCTISIVPVAALNMATAYASTSSGDIALPGSNPRVQGSWIQTDLFVCGAIGYSWSFNEVNYVNGDIQLGAPYTLTSTSRQVRLWPTSIPNIAAGKRYQVQVAPIFPWGTGSFDATQRYVQIAGSAGMVEENNNDEVVLVDKSLTTGVFASLYPNPNNGENVNINIAGIESESVNIRIMDASGRTVWSNNFFVEGILATTVSFDRPLAAGIYMVEMNYNGEISTQRMVVQK
jgi:hypothetical protein